MADDTDAPRLDEAQRRLAAEHYPLALWLARRVRVWRPWRREELESVAGLAACVAALEYRGDGEHGPFPGFLARRVRWQAAAAVRAQAPRGLGLRKSGAGRRRPPGGGEPVVSGVLGTDLDGYEAGGRLVGREGDGPPGAAFDAEDEARGLIARLPPRLRPLMELAYLHGMTQADAARTLGLPARTAAAMHDEAIDRLAGRWEGREAFGRAIRAARERAGLTRGRLADRIGRSPSAVKAIEAGRLVPNEALTRALNAALGLGDGDSEGRKTA